MDYINHKNISYCTVFQLELSQDELEVYESCMKYVQEHCSEDEIYKITGCTLNELSSWHKELKNMIISYVDEVNLPDKYKNDHK